MAIQRLTSAKFDEFISENSVIDFYADWCAPCRILSPIIEEVSSDFKKAKFGKVDIDKEFELAQKFGIMSVPSVLFFKNKKNVDRFTGTISKEELIKKLEKIF